MCEEYKCLVKLGEILATLTVIYVTHKAIVEELEGDLDKAVRVYCTFGAGITFWSLFYGLYWLLTL